MKSTFGFHLLLSQLFPVQPLAHVQVLEFEPSVQLAPFRHGSLVQSSTSGVKILSKTCLITTCRVKVRFRANWRFRCHKGIVFHCGIVPFDRHKSNHEPDREYICRFLCEQREHVFPIIFILFSYSYFHKYLLTIPPHSRTLRLRYHLCTTHHSYKCLGHSHLCLKLYGFQNYMHLRKERNNSVTC